MVGEVGEYSNHNIYQIVGVKPPNLLHPLDFKLSHQSSLFPSIFLLTLLTVSFPLIRIKPTDIFWNSLIKDKLYF